MDLNKVAIFTECFTPTTNGVVVSVKTFQEILKPFGWEYIIFAPSSRGFLDFDPSKVIRYPSFTWFSPKDYPLAVPFLAPRQTKKIFALKPVLVHTQHMFIMGKLGLNLGKKLHVPVIHTYHTLIAEYTHYAGFLSPLVKKYLIWKSRKYCNACDQIVTPSTQMKEVLVKYGVKTPIKVIPTGIKPENFAKPFTREEISQKWPSVPKDKVLVLYVSRVAKEKNLEMYFKAIKMLSEINKNFHLLIVGGGPELDYFKNLAKEMKIDHCVTFAGMIPKGPGVDKIFGASDIFAFPSVTETQGIVIAEAMVSGTAVLAADRMGPKDIVKNNINGLLIEPTEKAFSDSLDNLINDRELRERFSNQGKIDALEFSEENTAKKMNDLYEEVRSHYNS
jgi:glycosyltransferase involved in cell wall biosynthesis